MLKMLHFSRWVICKLQPWYSNSFLHSCWKASQAPNSSTQHRKWSASSPSFSHSEKRTWHLCGPHKRKGIWKNNKTNFFYYAIYSSSFHFPLCSFLFVFDLKSLCSYCIHLHIFHLKNDVGKCCPIDPSRRPRMLFQLHMQWLFSVAQKHGQSHPERGPLIRQFEGTSGPKLCGPREGRLLGRVWLFGCFAMSFLKTCCSSNAAISSSHETNSSPPHLNQTLDRRIIFIFVFPSPSLPKKPAPLFKIVTV